MTSEPVSKLPDPKYAGMTDDTIRGLEDRLRSSRSGEYPVHILCDKAADALRTALAQLEEARAGEAHWKANYNGLLSVAKENEARLADLVKPEESREWLPSATIDRLQARAEAAEARLEELTRERDEAKANGSKAFSLGIHHQDRAERAEAERDALTARLEEAKAVLGPFVAAFERCQPDEDEIRYGARQLHELKDDECAMIFPTAASLRAARAFLHQGGEDAR